MARREIPEQWLGVLEKAGLHSARDLARRLEVSPQTAARLIWGEESSRDTIEAAAGVLKLPVERVHELRGEVALPPFRLPPEADHLSRRQRAAVVAVVKAMLEPDALAREDADSAAALRLIADARTPAPQVPQEP